MAKFHGVAGCIIIKNSVQQLFAQLLIKTKRSTFHFTFTFNRNYKVTQCTTEDESMTAILHNRSSSILQSGVAHLHTETCNRLPKARSHCRM